MYLNIKRKDGGEFMFGGPVICITYIITTESRDGQK